MTMKTKKKEEEEKEKKKQCISLKSGLKFGVKPNI
jgi:hypothetical protein